MAEAASETEAEASETEAIKEWPGSQGRRTQWKPPCAETDADGLPAPRAFFSHLVSDGTRDTAAALRLLMDALPPPPAPEEPRSAQKSPSARRRSSRRTSITWADEVEAVAPADCRPAAPLRHRGLGWPRHRRGRHLRGHHAGPDT